MKKNYFFTKNFIWLSLVFVCSIAHAALPDGALLTGPAMQSSFVIQPNILISIDNTLQSKSEVAWVPKDVNSTYPNSTYPTMTSGAALNDANKYTIYLKQNASGVLQNEYFFKDRLTPFVISTTTPYKLLVSPTLSFGRTGTSMLYTHTNLIIAKSRSHHGNPMYYNPAMTYSPWNNTSHSSYKFGKSATTSFPATAAPLDISITDSVVVDLTRDYSYKITGLGIDPDTGVSNNSWEAHVQDGTGLPFEGTPANPAYTDTFKLATYYVYKHNNTGLQHIQDSPVPDYSLYMSFAEDGGRYKKVVIDPSTASYDWYPTRTDCVIAAGSCSYSEELENFKNWFIYYRTKLNAQKAITSWALSRLGNEFRVGLKLNYSASSGGDIKSNLIDVKKFDVAGRSALMSALFDIDYGKRENSLMLNLIGVGEYFKNNATHKPWLDDAGTQSTSCRPSAAFLLTDGSAVASNIASYDSKYTSGASLASGVIPINNNDYYDSSGNVIGTAAGTSEYKIDSWSSPLRAQFSGTASLTSIAHANYWYDLVSTVSNARLQGTNSQSALVLGSIANASGNILPFAGDPAAHQRLRLNVVSFGMPGANNPNYNKKNINPFSSANTSGGYSVPAPVWGAFSYHASQDELKNIDDLQQATINGLGKFIEWQSSSRQMRLDPRKQLLNQMTSLLPRNTGADGNLQWWYDEWYKSSMAGSGINGNLLLGTNVLQYTSNGVISSNTEAAIMEEPSTSGVPQVAVYESNFENRTGNGNLFAVNGSGYISAIINNTGSPAITSAPWYLFDAGRDMLSTANPVPAATDGRKIFAPTMTSASGSLGATVAFVPPFEETSANSVSQGTTATTGTGLNAFMMNAFFNNNSNLVWWLRGSSTHESPRMQDYDSVHRYPFRNRGMVTVGTTDKTPKLGSIINSHPVVARMQDFGYGAEATISGAQYRDFLVTKKAARPRVAVGSNDGMFRVFDGNAGPHYMTNLTSAAVNGPFTNPEDFAYIPAGVMGNLKQQADPHYMSQMKDVDVSDPDLGFRYTVDGAASTGDVQFSTNGPWKSVVTGSLGNGGRGLFAIDITASTPASGIPASMTAANVLWDKTVAGQWTSTDWPDVGAIRNRAGILKLANGEFGVIVGNGAASDSGSSTLFILKPDDGTVLRKITASATGGGLMGVSFLFNYKRQVIAVYGGDLKGNLWKFDLSSATPSSWGVANSGLPLLVAKSSASKLQPITARPALMEHPEGLGTMVMVGTGSNFRYKDPGLEAQHTVYGVLDKTTVALAANAVAPAGATVARADMVSQTLSALPGVEVSGGGDARTLTANAVDYAVSKGWYVDLPFFNNDTNTYESVTGDPRIVSERLVVASATPMPAHSNLKFDTCDTRDILQGFVTSINPFTGGLLPWTVYDTNRDKIVDGGDDGAATGYGSKSGKTASGVMPNITRSGSGYVLTKEGDAMAASRKNPVKSWRELQPR
jgi:Neisseria PilC beta-propeller domain